MGAAHGVEYLWVPPNPWQPLAVCYARPWAKGQGNNTPGLDPAPDETGIWGELLHLFWLVFPSYKMGGWYLPVGGLSEIGHVGHLAQASSQPHRCWPL